MKRKKFYLTALCIVLTCSVYATHTSLKETTGNWLQRSDSPQTEDTETPPEEPWGEAPVGDAPFLLILGFGFLYIASRSLCSTMTHKKCIIKTR
jgi:hypothetical protein